MSNAQNILNPFISRLLTPTHTGASATSTRSTESFQSNNPFLTPRARDADLPPLPAEEETTPRVQEPIPQPRSRSPLRDPLPSIQTPNVTGSSYNPPPFEPPVAIQDEEPLGPPDIDSLDVLPDEAPPAYTPMTVQGEHTVQIGPRRPFQPAPGTYQPPAVPPGFNLGVSLANLSINAPVTPQTTGRSTQRYNPPSQPPPTATAANVASTGRSAGSRPNTGRETTTTTPSTARARRQPPPTHPSSPNVNLPTPSVTPRSTGGRSELSDFARDFYATAPVEGLPAGSEPEASRSRSTPPASSSSRTGYAPPPGPPPTAEASSSRRYSPPAGQPPRRNSNEEDDGKPTRTPTPGRPLLNNDRVLVFPQGYICRRCDNVGYRNADPTKPCDKCWRKYGKPYGGALAYAPWKSSSVSNSSNRVQLQRPLPPFTSLGHAHSRSQPTLAIPPSSNSRNAASSPTTPNRLSRSHSHARIRDTPATPTSPMPGSFPSSSRISSAPTGGRREPPATVGYVSGERVPQGALVVMPGDSRIGGRMCWRCSGTGQISFLIFDIEQCPVCGGVGRTFA